MPAGIIVIVLSLNGSVSHPVNYVYHKMLLNENESYLVLVSKQISLVTIKNVY